MRQRQIKNFLATLLLSQGVPMLLAGDECRRTQRGNNNAYCQDNQISWFDWSLVEQNAELVRFVKALDRISAQQSDAAAAKFFERHSRTAGRIARCELVRSVGPARRLEKWRTGADLRVRHPSRALSRCEPVA